MKHKHSELIKAWADGAEIQIKHLYHDVWFDILNPNWRTDREYRIKPNTLKIEVELTQEQCAYLAMLMDVSNREVEMAAAYKGHPPYDGFKLMWANKSPDSTFKKFTQPIYQMAALTIPKYKNV